MSWQKGSSNMEKTKAKFNLFDVVIIIAVLAIAFGAYRYLIKKTSSQGSAPAVTFTVELQKQGDDYADEMEIGDDISDAVKGGYFGKITDIKREKCYIVNESSITGEYVKTEMKGKYNYYITIEGIPSYCTDASTMFGSCEVGVGREIYIKNRNYVGAGYVVDISFDK